MWKSPLRAEVVWARLRVGIVRGGGNVRHASSIVLWLAFQIFGDTRESGLDIIAC